MQAVLVKYDSSGLSEEEINKCEFVNNTLIIISGTIKQMPGHVLCLDMKTGKPYILHPESLIELTEEEV